MMKWLDKGPFLMYGYEKNATNEEDVTFKLK